MWWLIVDLHRLTDPAIIGLRKGGASVPLYLAGPGWAVREGGVEGGDDHEIAPGLGAATYNSTLS